MAASTRPRLWAPWVGAALALGAAVVAVTVTSHHHTQQPGSAALELLVGWSFTLAGVLAIRRRPENGTGRLLILVGLTFLVANFDAANNRVLYTLGEALSALSVAVFAHLLFAYPEGRLVRRPERIAVACGYSLALASNVVTLLVDPHPDCKTCTASNLLLAHRSPSAAHLVTVVTDVLAALLLVWIVFLLFRRWQRASAVVRRAIKLVRWTGGPALALLGVSFAAGVASKGAENVISEIAFLLFALVPYAFLIGVLRMRFAPGAVTRKLVAIPETASLAETQAALRAALGDPGLRVGAWLPERKRYVDPDGKTLTLEEVSIRVTTLVSSHEGTRLAAVEHDRALLAEPELLESALAAARLSLHRNRLQTELQARLDELQRERDFIAAVVNASPAFFCVIDLEGRIVRFNRTLEVATGIPDDDLVRGRPLWEVFPIPSDADGVRYTILAAAPGEHEHRWRSADGGEPLVIAWSLTPITDGHGNERFVITALDVSDRARHAAEIQSERDFLTRVGRATPTLLCVVHGDGVVCERGVNMAFAKATGFGDDVAIGRPFWELVAPPGKEEEIRNAFLTAVETGRQAWHEMEWSGLEGTTFVAEWWTASLSSYRPNHYLVCANDVTKRKHDEDEIRRSRARLVAAADAERSRLERNLHDGAQQRLVSLSLALRLAEAKLERDPAEARSILGRASGELGLALQELRELARGLHPAVLTDRGLGAALEALAERSAVPVELQLDLERRLPSGVEVAIFYVASETLANIVKHAAATAVTVRLLDHGDNIAVEIADDGCGGADPHGGTGLRGLADRVAALDGSIEVDSPPGEGTRIVATFPLARVWEAVPQETG
jgi:PAS domain S-box-containing protein